MEFARQERAVITSLLSVLCTDGREKEQVYEENLPAHLLLFLTTNLSDRGWVVWEEKGEHRRAEGNNGGE